MPTCQYRENEWRCMLEVGHVAGKHYLIKRRSFFDRYPIITILAYTYMGAVAVLAVTIGTLIAVTA